MPSLCFGGSFNPIHNGHLRCAQAVATAKGYDRVLLIPSGQPPHKGDTSDLAPAADRLAMCQLAAAGANLFEADDIETRRSGPSYTLDTVQELRRRGMWSPIHWLIGADMLMYLPKWHRPIDLLREVHFVVMRRPGFEIEWRNLPPEFQGLKENVVDAPLIDISATDIRGRVREGKCIDDLVPLPVAEYIARRGLYRD
jgi:nicotinate-nucleotide adenylyltransferase